MSYEDQVREASRGWVDVSEFHKGKKGKKKKKKKAKKVKKRVRELEQGQQQLQQYILFSMAQSQVQASTSKKSKKGKKAKKGKKKRANQLLWQELAPKVLDFATAYYASKSSSKTFSKAPNWDTVYESVPPSKKQTPLALPEARR